MEKPRFNLELRFLNSEQVFSAVATLGREKPKRNGARRTSGGLLETAVLGGGRTLDKSASVKRERWTKTRPRKTAKRCASTGKRRGNREAGGDSPAVQSGWKVAEVPKRKAVDDWY